MWCQFKYLVQENDHFNSGDYPDVVEEIGQMHTQLVSYPKSQKVDIIISYYKSHSIPTEWISANPMITQVVLSGKMGSQHLEGLFESCNRNKPFLSALETYIRETI